MARYFITLSYDGAAYCGWQRQPDAPTVQQTVEKALSTLLRCSVEVVGAGRTDTGVNASKYVAHFDVDTPIADCRQLVYKLNLVLPHDIAVQRVRRRTGSHSVATSTAAAAAVTSAKTVLFSVRR